MDTMGKRIEFFRKKRGLTQKDLADKLNLKNGGTVSAWEVDTTSPKPAMMLELCKVLDISISELFGVEEEEKKPLSPKMKELLKRAEDLNEEGQERLAEYTGFLGFKYKKD